MIISYRPWVPKEGMAGFFLHLSKTWGSPNLPQHKWPQSILEKVAERSDKSLPLTMGMTEGRFYF